MKNLDNILKKCVKGDEKSLDSLYLHYRSMWYMLSLRYSRSKDEAQDILQEGLVQIFRDLKQFNPQKAQFSTWSNRVLVHAAIKYLKRSNWQNTFVDFDDIPIDLGNDSDILSNLSNKELINMISKLPLGYRVVFNMYAIEGYSHKEIGLKLGISVGTSKSQLFKARKVLKKCVERQLI